MGLTIAKSPVDITRESTTDLYARLGASQPVQYHLRQLLERRVTGCPGRSGQCVVSQVFSFSQQLKRGSFYCSSFSKCSSMHSSGFHRPYCAQPYLRCLIPNTRCMRIHHAKEHKSSLVNTQQEEAAIRRDVDAAEHGMPTCVTPKQSNIYVCIS